MRLPALATLLLPLAVACGGPSDPSELVSQGNKALGSGDLEAAKADFDEALAVIGTDTSHPDYLRARMGAIEARTASEPEEAKEMFLALAAERPEEVDDRDFNRVAGLLGDAKNYAEATALLSVGIERYPESPHLAKLRDSLGDRAQVAGDSEALEALQGLGYVGK